MNNGPDTMRALHSLPLLTSFALGACATVDHVGPPVSVPGAPELTEFEPFAAAVQVADYEPDYRWRFGGELQTYPAGLIAALIAVYPLYDDDDFIFRVGYNATDRSDFGEHDDETGGGAGFGFEALHYFSGRDTAGWIVGARVDSWWLSIDWVDNAAGLNPRRSGSTDIVVIQPMVEAGYVWPGKAGDLAVILDLGWEVNVWQDDGEDVGEGATLLLGLRYLF